MRSSLAALSTAAMLLASTAVPAYARQAAPPALRPIRLVMTPVRPTPAIRFETRVTPLSAPLVSRRAESPSRLKRAMWASIAGVGGFFGGGFLGAAIEGDRCDCDDPGLQGFLIGAPVGAALGAIFGWKFGR